jgi:DNA-binding LytR/AlgR family response regulator
MQDYLFVRCNAKYVRINYSELICIRGKRGYILIVTETDSFIVLNKLNEIIDHLPKSLFCRIHHSYIVSVKRIKSFDNSKVYLYGEPQGKNYREGLAKALELPVGAFYRKHIRETLHHLPSYTGRKSGVVKDAEKKIEFELDEN